MGTNMENRYTSKNFGELKEILSSFLDHQTAIDEENVWEFVWLKANELYEKRRDGSVDTDIHAARAGMEAYNLLLRTDAEEGSVVWDAFDATAIVTMDLTLAAIAKRLGVNEETFRDVFLDDESEPNDFREWLFKSMKQ